MSYEGQCTSRIYTLIKEQEYSEAIKELNFHLENNPRSRAALSLLGYCNYLSGFYEASAEMYQQLIKYYPDVAEYRIYLAQALYKAENYEEALRAANSIPPDYNHQKSILQFAIKYQMNELNESEKILNNAMEDRQETLICRGCVLYKENKFEEAQKMFTNAKNLGDSPDIEYNIGVCNYKMKMLSGAHNCIQSIIENANKNHPDIVLKGLANPGMPRQSLANSPALYESCLIEAYNLKAAIDYHLNNIEDAKECLNDMPPREDEELDSVTLHNLALVNIEKDPDDSFKKLNFLLKNPVLYKNNYYVLKNIQDFCQFSFKKFKIENPEEMTLSKCSKEFKEFEEYLIHNSLIVHKTTSNIGDFEKVSEIKCNDFISSTLYYKHITETQYKEYLILGFVDGTLGIVDMDNPKMSVTKIKDNYHTDPILSLFIDKEYVYSGSVDTFIKKWKIEIKAKTYSLSYRSRYRGHSNDVNKIMKLEGFDNIISCSSDKRIIIWNTKLNEGQTDIDIRKEISFDFPVVSIMNIGHKNQILVATTDNKITVYDVMSKKTLSQLDNIVCNYSNCLMRNNDEIIIGANKMMIVVKVNEEGIINEIKKVDFNEDEYKEMDISRNMVNVVCEGKNEVWFANGKRRIYRINMNDNKLQYKEFSGKGNIDYLEVIGGKKVVVVFGKYVEILGS